MKTAKNSVQILRFLAKWAITCESDYFFIGFARYRHFFRKIIANLA